MTTCPAFVHFVKGEAYFLLPAAALSIRRKAMEKVKKYAPFLTSRWWVLHTVAIAAAYAVGALLWG